MIHDNINNETTGYSRREQTPYSQQLSETTEEPASPTAPQATAFSLATFLKNNVWALLPAVVLMATGVHINTIEFWIDMAAIIFSMYFYSKFGNR